MQVKNSDVIFFLWLGGRSGTRVLFYKIAIAFLKFARILDTYRTGEKNTCQNGADYQHVERSL